MKTPSPALVVSLIALIVALGGTGYAVTQLPRNSVGTAQIKNNAVTTAKVRNNAITGAKVRDGSLTARDFRPGTLLQGPAGPQGAPGPQGPAGATGATGAQGEPGPTATAAVATSVPVDDLGVAFTGVISLGDAATGIGRTSTGAIQVNSASRLIIQATLELRQTTMPDPGAPFTTTVCILRVNGGNLVAPDIGRPTSTIMRGGGDEMQVSLSGAVSVGPGSYDVGAACGKSSGLGQVEFVRGVLTVIAGGA